MLKYFLRNIFLLFVFLFVRIESKIRILLLHYNRPDFIVLQHEKFKKFLIDKDYEIFVFNDSRDTKIINQIDQVCKKLNLNHIKVPQKIHVNSILYQKIQKWKYDFPSLCRTYLKPLSYYKKKDNVCLRHCNVIKYVLNNYGYKHNDILIMCEGDVFPIRPINVREFCKNFHIVGNIRGMHEFEDPKIPINYNLHYLWPGIIFIDMRNLPNKFDLSFDLTYIGRFIGDTGGSTYYYMKKNNNVKVKKFPTLSVHRLATLSENELKKFNFNSNEIDLIRSMSKFKRLHETCEFHLGNYFLHFFDTRKKVIEKEKIILSFLKNI